MVHVISCVISLLFGYLHIKAHWTWYKKIFETTKRKKSKTSIILSAIFLVEIITGLVLILIIDGPNSGVGLFHYGTGIAMGVCLLIHTISRFKIMMKGLRWI